MRRPHLSFFRAIPRKCRSALRVARAQGAVGLYHVVRSKWRAAEGAPSTPISLLDSETAMLVDWTTPHPAVIHPLVVTDRPLRLAWITSPPGPESGGHQNIWRFVAAAERAGHACSIHLYDAAGLAPSVTESTEMTRKSTAYSRVNASLRTWDSTVGVGGGNDAIIATGWETAYASWADPSPARRLYFVQDYEPLFYPVGSQSVFAENTYRFGFDAITAGRWLSSHLKTEYGLTTYPFDFAADTSQYRVSNESRREGVFFYARPVTSRRAYEMGVLALELFHRKRPEATIHLAGWPVHTSHLGFPAIGHGSLPLEQLNDLYNDCAAGLVLSLTNMSLLPLELLAAGVTPVINDAPNNRLVSNNPRFGWAATNPQALARALVTAFDDNYDGRIARANEAAVPAHSWEDSGKQFDVALRTLLGQEK